MNIVGQYMDDNSNLILQLLHAAQNPHNLLIQTLLSNHYKTFNNYVPQQNVPMIKIDQTALTSSSSSEFLTQQNDVPQTSPNNHLSTKFPSVKLPKPEGSNDRKRLNKAKHLLERPRVHTNPNSPAQMRKMRPRTQSSNTGSIERHNPKNLPTRNPDACALEEVAMLYLLNGLPSSDMPNAQDNQQNVPIKVFHKILDHVLQETLDK